MENQTENTNVTTENKPQSEPLHKSFCRECGTMISEKRIYALTAAPHSTESV